MRESGRIAAAILQRVAREVKQGVATKELNNLAEKLIAEYGVEPAFRGQPSGKKGEPYPAVICVSVNHVVVHGVPSDYVIQDGDVVSLDFGVKYQGYYSDLALTILVGNMSDEARRLVDVTKRALAQAIKKVRPGITTGDIGNTVERWVRSRGRYEVVRDLVGHGIGRELHEFPQVPNFGKRGTGEILREGMVLAIEPMVVAGSWELVHSPDGHGYETKDLSLSAHFEHTVAVTKEGREVLTSL